MFLKEVGELPMEMAGLPKVNCTVSVSPLMTMG